MGTQSNSLCPILWFFRLLIVLLQSMGKVWAQSRELSLPAADTGATAHVTVCCLCCRGTWADGWKHAGRRRRKGKKLKSDMIKEILMKVKRSSGEGEPGLRNSVGSPMCCTFLGKTAWAKGVLEMRDFDKRCPSPISSFCGNVFSLLAMLPQVRTADANSKKAIKLHAG